MKIDKKILKVSQLNSATKAILEANFALVWVEGEISNLSEPSSGHIYFSLKDEFSQIRAAMFRGRKLGLRFQPKNGAHVIVAAQVSLYEQRGDYQLIVDHMELAGTGALHAKFLQLKAKLDAENLFDIKYKKTLPRIPKNIGVITSPTGAVIQDILNVLNRRFPGVNIIIYPTQVQGDNAAMQIVDVLRIANERQECDVLILARGGGSLEDLWSFNEEIVARAIFASKIPIISAVGHETDFTIADFVADVRAPTPSAAAELAVPNIDEWLNNIVNLEHKLINAMQYKLKQAKLLLENLTKLLRHPKHYLLERAQRLDELEHNLCLHMKNNLFFLQQYLTKVSAALDLVSPLATLDRGYAIIAHDGHECHIVQKINNVKVGDKIQAKLADGVLHCVVNKILSDVKNTAKG